MHKMVAEDNSSGKPLKVYLDHFNKFLFSAFFYLYNPKVFSVPRHGYQGTRGALKALSESEVSSLCRLVDLSSYSSRGSFMPRSHCSKVKYLEIQERNLEVR